MWKHRLSLRFAGKGHISGLKFVRGWLEGRYQLAEVVGLIGHAGRISATMQHIRKHYYDKYKAVLGWRKDSQMSLAAAKQTLLDRCNCKDYTYITSAVKRILAGKKVKSLKQNDCSEFLKSLNRKQLESLLREATAQAQTNELRSHYIQPPTPTGRGETNTAPLAYLNLARVNKSNSVLRRTRRSIKRLNPAVSEFEPQGIVVMGQRFEGRWLQSHKALCEMLSVHDKDRERLQHQQRNSFEGASRVCQGRAPQEYLTFVAEYNPARAEE